MERWNDGRLIGQDKTGKDGEVDVCVEREREKERERGRKRERREGEFVPKSIKKIKNPAKINPKSTKKRPKIHQQINKN